MKKLVTLILAAAFVCGIGCARKVIKNWEAAGGSRSDATIVVGYTYYPGHEQPQVDPSQAQRVALDRCRNWGYENAEPFGMISRRPDGVGGVIVTQSFQCLGRGDLATPNEPEIPAGKKIKP